MMLGKLYATYIYALIFVIHLVRCFYMKHKTEIGTEHDCAIILTPLDV